MPMRFGKSVAPLQAATAANVVELLRRVARLETNISRVENYQIQQAAAISADIQSATLFLAFAGATGLLFAHIFLALHLPS